MTERTEVNSSDAHRPRRRRLPSWLLPLLIAPLFAGWVLLALDDDGNIALVRNDVVDSDSGSRVWHGTMGNTTDSQYRDIAVTIRFLDNNDQPVGQVKGAASVLEPGESFDLKAPLPMQAAAIQVYHLEWRTGRRDKTPGEPLGPWAPWPFGHVQTSWP